MPSYWDASGKLVDGRYELSGSKVAEGIADMVLNTQGTLLANAARIASTQSANQTNYNAKGVMLLLNVATAGAAAPGGLTIRIYYVGASGNIGWITLNSAPITVAGSAIFELYPGINTTVPTGSSSAFFTSLALPRSWYAYVLAGDASSYTYSLDYSLIL